MNINLQTNHFKNYNTTSNTKTAFGAKTLANINLLKAKDNNYKLTKAKFKELIPDSQKDRDLINDLVRKWHVTEYIEHIAANFLFFPKNIKFYATELCSITKDKFDKLTCLMVATDPEKKAAKKTFDVCFLQAAPNIANQKNKSAIKGSGEIMIYEAVKTAKKHEFENVSLFSTNNDFYDKIGFERGDSNFNVTVYSLPKSKFNDFMNKVEKKYHLK